MRGLARLARLCVNQYCPKRTSPRLIALMLAKGIGVEAGLATVADARRFVLLPAVKECLRVLVEIDFEERRGCRGARRRRPARPGRQSRRAPRPLARVDASVWPLYRKSLALQIDARLGFEDGVRLADGQIAADNRGIIVAAHTLP